MVDCARHNHATMTTPVCGRVLVGAGVITLLALMTLPMYPIAAISFEAGLVTGLLLHSSHISYAISAGFLDTESFKGEERE